MSRLQFFMGAPLIALVTILNLAHPLLHGFEGGSLDVALVYLNMMAACSMEAHCTTEGHP